MTYEVYPLYHYPTSITMIVNAGQVAGLLHSKTAQHSGETRVLSTGANGAWSLVRAGDDNEACDH